MFSASLPLYATTLWVAGLGVEVRSTADCPSAQEVSQRLAPLLPPFPGPAHARDIGLIQVLEIHNDGTTDLWLRLHRFDGSDIGTRRVSLSGGCAEMAETVATLFATWKIDPKPEGAADPEPMPGVARSAPPAPIPQPATGFDYVLGAGAGAAMVGGLAATGSLELMVGRPTSHWHVRLGVASQTARKSDLAPPGQVKWRHTNAALGLVVRLPHPRWVLSLDAGPLAGWVTLAGQGFVPGREKRSFDFGGTSGLRAGRRFGRWSVWAEGRLALWLQGHRATLTGSPLVRELPVVDGMVSLGASMPLFP